MNADWVSPIGADVWGRRVWTVPPNSQGYLTVAGAWIAGGLPLPTDADDALWAKLHEHFTVPELVELGFFIALTLGQQRWIKTLGIGHQEVLSDNTAGLTARVGAG